MKTLILLLSITLLLTSCGGSSSSGGKGKKQNNIRRNPSKPAGQVKALSPDSAINLLELSKDSLEALRVGSVFEKHSDCENIINGEKTRGEYIRRYTLLKLNTLSLRAQYKVDVINFPGENDCGYVGTDYKSFLLEESVYGEYGENLVFYIENLLVNRKFGLIESSGMRVLLVNGELNLRSADIDSGMEVIKNFYEIGADLNQSFTAGSYMTSEFKANVLYEGNRYRVESYSREYTYNKGIVDIGNISTANLPLFYVDPNQ